MAQQLQSKGETVALLALVDSTAPQASIPEAPPRQMFLEIFALNMGLTLKDVQPLTQDTNGWLNRSLDEQLTAVLELGCAVGKIPYDMTRAQAARFYEIGRQNVTAVWRYKGQLYDGPTTLFKATQQVRSGVVETGLGWEHLISNLRIHLVPGNHLTMMHPPHVHKLAEEIARCLRSKMVA
jgi:thioesterase domain-containing protein